MDGYCCPNTELTCWQKVHTYYQPKGLCTKAGNLRRGSGIYKARAEDDEASSLSVGHTRKTKNRDVQKVPEEKKVKSKQKRQTNLDLQKEEAEKKAKEKTKEKTQSPIEAETTEVAYV